MIFSGFCLKKYSEISEAKMPRKEKKAPTTMGEVVTREYIINMNKPSMGLVSSTGLLVM